MLLTYEEVRDSGLHVKTWISNMQREARSPGAPTFELGGPRMMSTKLRRSIGYLDRPYIGGESFSIASVIAERNDRDGSVQIEVTMVPTRVSEAAEISAVRLLLAEAMMAFPGMEEFAMRARKNSIAYGEEWRHLEVPAPAPAPAPRVAKRENNPMWGSW